MEDAEFEREQGAHEREHAKRCGKCHLKTRNTTEEALVRVLLEAVRRVSAIGVDPSRVRFEVRVSPRSGEETAWVTVPVMQLPALKLQDQH